MAKGGGRPEGHARLVVAGVVARIRIAFALGPIAVAYFAALAGAGWVWMAIALANLAFQCTRPWKNEFDELRKRLPEPPPGERFRDRAVFRRESMVIGRDTLAYTFVDGWLVGEGLRSEFALRPQDVARLELSGNDAPALQESAAAVLELTDGGEIVLAKPGHAAWSALERWHEGGRPEGAPTFPPAGAHEQELARWAVWGTLGAGIIGVPNLIAAYLHLGGEYGQVRGLSILLAFAWAWSSGRRFFRLGEITMAANRSEALEEQAPPLQGPSEEANVRIR